MADPGSLTGATSALWGHLGESHSSYDGQQIVGSTSAPCPAASRPAPPEASGLLAVRSPFTSFVREGMHFLPSSFQRRSWTPRRLVPAMPAT